MFGLFANDTEHLDELITKTVVQMNEVDPDTEEYQKLLLTLERLTKLKTDTRPERVSRNTIALIAANLIGTVIIVGYEHTHVMVSKAFGNVMKPQ